MALVVLIFIVMAASELMQPVNGDQAVYSVQPSLNETENGQRHLTDLDPASSKLVADTQKVQTEQSTDSDKQLPSSLSSNNTNSPVTVDPSKEVFQENQKIALPITTETTNTKQSSLNQGVSKEDAATVNSDTADLTGTPDIIVGRVFTDGGQTVADITLTAKPFNIASTDADKPAITLISNTNEQGYYAFRNILNASYRICSNSSDLYSSTCIQVLPPQQTADLKVNRLSDVKTLRGIVTDEQNTPVADVFIRISGSSSSQAARTDANGRYQMPFKTQDNYHHKIHFTKANYQSLAKALPDNSQGNDYIVDANLTALSGLTVTGNVVDKNTGDPVTNQRVALYSPNLRYSTSYVSSNIKGQFTIKNVKPAEDYEVRMSTDRNHRYVPTPSSKGISISDSSTVLSLEVESLQFELGTFTATIRNQQHAPLANLTIELSQGSYLIAKQQTDSNGVVSFAEVPAGSLQLYERSLPLRASGIDRNRHDNITLTADHGDQEIRIAVTGTNGQAVVCNRSQLSWRYKENDVSISSSKTVQSDSLGIIRRTDLGSGEHTLSLSGCPEHKNKTQQINIGSQNDINIQLEASNSQ